MSHESAVYDHHSCAIHLHFNPQRLTSRSFLLYTIKRAQMLCQYLITVDLLLFILLLVFLLPLFALDVHCTLIKGDSTRSSSVITTLYHNLYQFSSDRHIGYTMKAGSILVMSLSPTISLPTGLLQETCLRRGLCPVSVSLYEPPTTVFSHSIYYEQHGVPGTDPIKGAEHKIVFLMGLNSSCFAWGPQVRYFGGGGGGGTTALVFDNRGVGNSEYPRGPYS